MSVAGLDVGTTGCKCSVYTDGGELLKEAYREYDFPADCGQRELDAAVIWECVQEVIREAAQVPDPLKAIGVASMGEAAVLLDEKDEPLCRPILYFDPRGQEQIDRVVCAVGIERLREITWMEPQKIYTITKIMWEADRDPQILNRARHLLLMQDYIVYMLSGIAQIDYTLATRTYAFDMKRLTWSREILDACGIPERLWSRCVPTGTAAGPVRPEVAERLGVPEDLLIVTGAHDQPAALIGNGVLNEGLGSDSTGTNECITTVFESRNHPDYIGHTQLTSVPFLRDGLFTTAVFSFTGGGMLKWYREQFGKYERQIARERGIGYYDRMEELIPGEPTELLVYPYFLGKGAPDMNPRARACILGLTMETKAEEIYRALMEGVSYEIRMGLDYLKEKGIEIRELRATGGGARSAAWLQIKADVYGVPVHTMKVQEGGNLACAMLAAIAAGLYPDIETAAAQFIHVDQTFLPDPERKAFYDRQYQRYRSLVSVINDIYQ
ncbi:MAG: hypothetical protein II930_08090 [Lachnospiraceae bacterium]|nr:hypothetical protein [Lachnospiraceae bacterium]